MQDLAARLRKKRSGGNSGTSIRSEGGGNDNQRQKKARVSDPEAVGMNPRIVPFLVEFWRLTRDYIVVDLTRDDE